MYICLTKESKQKLIKMIESDSFSIEDILLYSDKLLFNEYKAGYGNGCHDGYCNRMEEER